MTYEYTHLTWRRIDDEGHVSNLVHIIEDKERAADEIRELVLTPGVFALRWIHYGEEPTAQEQTEATEFHTRIGPPVTG